MPDAEDQPALADMVDGRGLLGEPERVAERQHLHRRADLDALGASGYRRRDGERGREDGLPGGDVQFGQPHDVEAPGLGGIDLGEGLGECARLRLTGRTLKLVEDAELHPEPSENRVMVRPGGGAFNGADERAKNR